MSAIDDQEEPVLPVAPGDFVETKDLTYPRIGRVVRARWVDEGGKRICKMDVSMYNIDGVNTKRVSPAFDGPKNYEPWITYTDEWMRIAKPDFPVSLKWVPLEDGSGQSIAQYVTGAKRLGDRTVVRRRKTKVESPLAVKPKPPRSDFDPELEVRSRRMAAQQLRDINRAMPNPELIAKAQQLEDEAGRIAREHGMER
ncbi:hypothetical protein [Rhizobium sp. BK176]|uniref:hypothetical protein n=1 Tax=Rhizobium sp. BK176 TaxID=2587071 RepID=UPI002168454F|nr:hypothetical protein [Rhizobium sp. BK176]MCS4088842.1 hypothetical protein [Rhizobium sp. BK176]